MPDDDTIAHELFDNIRIFCWVMTAKENHRKKADHVKATWGRRCNYLYFMSDGDDEALPAMNLHTELGRDHLTAKTMKVWNIMIDYVFMIIYDLKDNFDCKHIYLISFHCGYFLKLHPR